MSSLIDDLRQPKTAAVPIGAWYGKIAVAPTDMGQKLSVLIPDVDGSTAYDKVRWQSRDDSSKPAQGDVCLVVFDNRGAPWVVAWWPFS